MGIKNFDAAEAGQEASSSIATAMQEQLAEQNQLMRKNNELLERHLKLSEQQAQANTETAANTRPKPPRITGGAETIRKARQTQ